MKRDTEDIRPTKCSQCGQSWESRACGPTHAAIYAESRGSLDIKESMAEKVLEKEPTYKEAKMAYFKSQVNAEQRPRITHELKIWPEYFQPVFNGRMKFQLRKADRDFKVGDELFLREWDPPVSGSHPKGYTGREVLVRVDYILKPFVLGTELPLDPEYVIMSISLV